MHPPYFRQFFKFFFRQNARHMEGFLVTHQYEPWENRRLTFRHTIRTIGVKIFHFLMLAANSLLAKIKLV